MLEQKSVKRIDRGKMISGSGSKLDISQSTFTMSILLTTLSYTMGND